MIDEGGIVPFIGEAENDGQQPFAFQGKGFVFQVIIAHHRIIPVLFDSEYGHM